MTIQHNDENMRLQAGLICVLNEAFDYPDQQKAYEAYHLAAKNQDRLISEMGIKLSGQMLPDGITTCKELVDHVDTLVSTIMTGLDYFLELAQGRRYRLRHPGSLVPAALQLVNDIENLQMQIRQADQSGLIHNADICSK